MSISYLTLFIVLSCDCKYTNNFLIMISFLQKSFQSYLSCQENHPKFNTWWEGEIDAVRRVLKLCSTEFDNKSHKIRV